MMIRCLRACKAGAGKGRDRVRDRRFRAEAIEMVKLRHARREPYNLILVDWKMPEMDGVETTRQIREIIGNESAIIILTAYRWDDVLEEAMQAGVDSFISKPLFAGSRNGRIQVCSQAEEHARQEAEESGSAGRRILLAEDVQINAEIMMMVLQMSAGWRPILRKTEGSPWKCLRASMAGLL